MPDKEDVHLWIVDCGLQNIVPISWLSDNLSWGKLPSFKS